MVEVEWFIKNDLSTSVRDNGSVLRVVILRRSASEEEFITLFPVEARLHDDRVLSLVGWHQEARHSISLLTEEGDHVSRGEYLVATFNSAAQCESLRLLLTHEGDSRLTLKWFLFSSNVEFASPDEDVVRPDMNIEVVLVE